MINDIKNDIIKIFLENKDIIIVEGIKYKQYDRCKITTNSFYKSTITCMNCEDIETKLCPLCKIIKSYTEFYNKGKTCISCLKQKVRCDNCSIVICRILFILYRRLNSYCKQNSFKK